MAGPGALSVDAAYMEKHLFEYVKYKLEQGFEGEAIKKALVRNGYNKEDVEKVLNRPELIGIEPHKQTKTSMKHMHEELELYVKNILVDYIMREHHQGYSFEAIKKALIRYGHDPKIVEGAFDAIERGQVHEVVPRVKIKVPPEVPLVISIFIALAVMFYISAQVNIGLNKIAINFLPTFAAIFIVYALFILIPNKTIRAMLPLLSIAIAVFGYVFLLQQSVIARDAGTDHQVVMVINAVLTFFLAAFMCLISRPSPRREKKRKPEKAEDEDAVVGIEENVELEKEIEKYANEKETKEEPMYQPVQNPPPEKKPYKRVKKESNENFTSPKGRKRQKRIDLQE